MELSTIFLTSAILLTLGTIFFFINAIRYHLQKKKNMKLSTIFLISAILVTLGIIFFIIYTLFYNPITTWPFPGSMSFAARASNIFWYIVLFLDIILYVVALILRLLKK